MGTGASTVSSEGAGNDEQRPTPVQIKTKIQIKKPSPQEKKQKRKEDIRRKMREQFRTLQLEEAVDKKTRGKQMKYAATDIGDDEAGGALDATSLRAQAEMYKDKGNTCIRTQHDLKGAIAAYTTAISLIQTNYIYFNNRAAAYLLAGEFANAVADCDSSLALEKRNIKAYTRKASALGQLHQFDSALDCIAQALALNPEDAETLHVQEVVLTQKVDQLKTDISSLASHLHHDTNIPPSLAVTAALPSLTPADAVSSGTNNTPPSSSRSLNAASSVTTPDTTSHPSRTTPTDRIRLSPLKISSNTLTPSQKKKQQQQPQQPMKPLVSRANGLTYPRNSSSICSFDVQAIGLPQSFFGNSGRFFRLYCGDIEHVLGAPWAVPILTLPPSLLSTAFQPDSLTPLVQVTLSPADVEQHEKELRAYLTLQGGQGGVFRTKNCRSGTIGGLCVWKYSVTDDDFDAVGCWNPFEYGHDDDWALGDRVELLDFIPAIFMKINRGLSTLVTTLDSEAPKQLHVLSSFKVVSSDNHRDVALWRRGGQEGDVCLAGFGQCGVASDWGALILEADLADVPHDDHCMMELVGVRTDCLKLPFSVEIKRACSQGGSGDEEEDGEWQECLSGALGPYVDLAREIPVHAPVPVVGVRLVWRSTELHLLEGLASTRTGGGLHAEVILLIGSR